MKIISVSFLLGGLLTWSASTVVAQIEQKEFTLVNPASGVKLWASVNYPSDASAQKKYPAVVFVPGGLGFGSQMARGQEASAIARAGFVIAHFDPDGRGKSEGWENWNGTIQQDGLHAFLKAVAALPFVDKNNVGVVSSSLGLALAAGALGRYLGDPPVKYFIDIEGPSDRFYITKNDDPHFLRIFAGQTTKDEAWWAEREAVRSIQQIACPYLRIQHERDHVHAENKQHALDMIAAATPAKFGGKGKSPWTRINGPENTPNTVYAKNNPPKWLSNQAGPRRADDTLRWIQEMAGVQKVESKGPKAADESRVTNQAFMTFAVNVHDWRHVDESAATVLRLIGIFEKHGVRGDFYFTPQIVEQYQQQRPDVIERLKNNGMGINYHVRPPHPTYAGFEGKLRGSDDAALAVALHDYETYRLDPATGELDRSRPGGYSYIAKVFGRAPTVVSPQCRDPRIRAAALKTYAALGAKMAVVYHERGTKAGQPFEWHDGLLARPSDFSITRWALPGEKEESFWWNQQESARATDFDPTARLKSELAAWRGTRPPFITALIHENDFSRTGPVSWSSIYYAGPRNSQPRSSPFDVTTPDQSRPRSAAEKEKIWKAYEALVGHAAAGLRVVTAGDIVAMADLQSDLTPVHGRGTPPGDAHGMGPWATRVMLATSTDGLNFTPTGQLISDQAGVPNVMMDRDGRARIYYIDFGNGNIIAAAIEKSPGEWVYRRVSITGLPRGTDAVDPTVVLLPDGRYRLYYMQGAPLPSIYSAISDDGIRFQKEDGVRFTAGNAPVFDPIVLQTPRGWRLWTGPDGCYSALSNDGLNFTPTGQFEVGGSRFMTWAAVTLPGGGYRLYGNFVGTGHGGLTSVFSKDGENWTHETGERCAAAPDNGTAVLRDGSYVMAYLTPIPRE